MAEHVGLSVLHPGGFKSTIRLAEELKINKNTRVIDIACGKGTTAIFLAKKYGCSVMGVDLSESLLEQAKMLVKKKDLDNLVSFKLADALNLPSESCRFLIATIRRSIGR